MGLVISLFATALVLFMVVAMAMAEWADKDPSQFLGFLKRKPEPVPVKAVSPAGLPAVTVAVRTTKSGTTQTKAVKRTRPSAKATGQTTVARKATTTKRKPR